MAHSTAQSPTARLLAGLAVILSATAVYSGYAIAQLHGLEQMQTGIIDRNRADSLLLLRIQNDLNSVALAMRDMLDGSEPYPLTAWQAQFRRIRNDLEDALARETRNAAVDSDSAQRSYLAASLSQFWDALDGVFALARSGKETEARTLIRLSLQARQEALATAVARLLVQNNEAEQQAGARVGTVYTRVERNSYVFVAAVLVLILFTSVYVVSYNRRVFRELAVLSARRSELAQQVISTQESTLSAISRELHDDFGQILTAIGSMLQRVERRMSQDPDTLRPDLREVQEIVQSTLEKVRSLSHTLHPVILDEIGFKSALDQYLPAFEKQTGIEIRYEKQGGSRDLDPAVAIHLYRVLQEALNNVAKHSKGTRASVRVCYLPAATVLEVQDNGSGFGSRGKQGMGLVSMRERADLVNGRLELDNTETGGALVRLTVPVAAEESHAGAYIQVLLADDHSLVRGERFRRMLEDDPEIAVVGEADDGQQAIDLALTLRPAVVVMDFALPAVNGATATRQILRDAPEIAVLMLSMHSEMSYVRASFEAGARGYLLKNAMDLELVDAVKQVAAGRQVLDPRLGTVEALDRAPRPQLTPREIEVLQLIAQGKSNKEIASILRLSANTVSVHRANLMQALGIHNTAELVLYAIRHGLVSIP